VLVPLNRREEVGVVRDGEPEGGVGDNRLRPIVSTLDIPAMRPTSAASSTGSRPTR
jgi:hypothetical protein